MRVDTTPSEQATKPTLILDTQQEQLQINQQQHHKTPLWQLTNIKPNKTEIIAASTTAAPQQLNVSSQEDATKMKVVPNL